MENLSARTHEIKVESTVRREVDLCQFKIEGNKIKDKYLFLTAYDMGDPYYRVRTHLIVGYKDGVTSWENMHKTAFEDHVKALVADGWEGFISDEVEEKGEPKRCTRCGDEWFEDSLVEVDDKNILCGFCFNELGLEG